MTVGPVKGDLHLVRQVTGHRQRLSIAEPIGEFLQCNLTIGDDSGGDRPRFSFRINLRGDRPLKRLSAYAAAAQALGVVETECPLELSQLQRRLAQLQACSGGIEVHCNLLPFAFSQGNVQLQLALQRTVALPARKHIRRADGGLLKNLQAITQTTDEITVDQQVTDLPVSHMRNIDLDIADLGIQKPALAGFDADSAVLDEYIPVHAIELWPARLERQRGVVHLEKQTDAARSGCCIASERALILEEPLIHRASQDRGAQPSVQCRAEHGWQVLGSVTTVTLDHADPKIHVVFLGAIEMQAYQKVAGDFSFVAHHLDVRGNQGKALLIQLPGQPGIGLSVLPGMSEYRVQMQHEVIRSQAQFALPQITADAAADIPGRRCAVIGIEADLVQIGRKA